MLDINTILAVTSDDATCARAEERAQVFKLATTTATGGSSRRRFAQRSTRPIESLEIKLPNKA